MKERTLAIIPARGGSKRIPNKNIRNFHGRPLMSYPIQTALQSQLFNNVVVSTDSKAIATIAQQSGAEVPFLRPSNLADDHTGTTEVLLHALAEIDPKGTQYDWLCCIYPTAPLLAAEDLKKGQATLVQKNADAAFSVTTYPYPIFRALKMKEGYVNLNWPEYESTRTNDLPEMYHDAGQFYWLKIKSFQKHKKLWPPKTLPIVLPRNRVQDIDTEEDWQQAERQFTEAHQK